jgi:hypothetical protein
MRGCIMVVPEKPSSIGVWNTKSFQNCNFKGFHLGGIGCAVMIKPAGVQYAMHQKVRSVMIDAPFLCARFLCDNGMTKHEVGM